MSGPPSDVAKSAEYAQYRAVCMSAVTTLVLGIISIPAILFSNLLFLPLIALFFLTGPFRKIMKPEQRKDLDAFVVRANAYIADQLA